MLKTHRPPLSTLFPYTTLFRSQLTSPVQCTLADDLTGEEVMAALFDMFDADALNPPPSSVEGPRYLITLDGGSDGDAPQASHYRSEEHTSELQSRENLVCRLLL